MISKVKKLNTEKLHSWLERTIKTQLKKDVSNYAKGRLRVWLGVEPTLTSPTRLLPAFDPGLQYKKALEDFIEWRFDYALVTYSGDEEAIGIDPHRDASYADYEAYGLNVTGICQFDYWEERESFGYSRTSKVLYPGKDKATDSLILEAGDLIRFNCKNQHSASPSVKRWNINFWRSK